MGHVLDFQKARAARFLRRVDELEAEGHVPAAAIGIATREFGAHFDCWSPFDADALRRSRQKE